jgi:hypothetical protein
MCSVDSGCHSHYLVFPSQMIKVIFFSAMEQNRFRERMLRAKMASSQIANAWLRHRRKVDSIVCANRRKCSVAVINKSCRRFLSSVQARYFLPDVGVFKSSFRHIRAANSDIGEQTPTASSRFVDTERRRKHPLSWLTL